MRFKCFVFILGISMLAFGQNHCLKNYEVFYKSDSLINKAFVLGKFNYKQHPNFEKVNSSYTSKLIYLDKRVHAAYIDMYTKAKADGISLKIISGTRNFTEQKAIWERKWKKYNHLKPNDRAKKILEYSSMPSTSRHHWGTDIDLNNFTNSYFETGQGKNEYEWLLKHANRFGFHQVYTDKSTGRTGYNLERWHWSYMPLANAYLRFYNKHIDYSDIQGFEGSEYADKLNIITNYVNGISEVSKHITNFKK